MNVNKQNTTVPIYPKLYGHRKRYTHNYNVFFSWEKTRTENKRNETKRNEKTEAASVWSQLHFCVLMCGPCSVLGRFGAPASDFVNICST